MKRAKSIIAIVTLVPMIALGGDPAGSAFTFQGQVKLAGRPLADSADFEFSLWDAEQAGVQIGATVTKIDLPMRNGLFSADLDFGTSAFDGQQRWLAISVRSPSGVGPYTEMTRRQALTAVPYAHFALNGGTGSGGGSLDDAYDFGGAGAGREIHADAGPVHIGGLSGLYVAGDVGLGTTTPAYDLHLQRSHLVTALSPPATKLGVRFRTFSPLGGENDDDFSYWAVGGGELGDLGTQFVRKESTPLRFGVRADHDTGSVDHQMTLTGAGNLGLGITNPSKNFEVADDQAVIRATSTSSSGGSVLELKSLLAGDGNKILGSVNFLDESNNVQGTVGYTEGPTITPGLSLTAGGATRMRVNSDGRVGIGVVRPKERLHVNGGYYGQGHMYLHAFEGDAQDGTAYIQARDDSGTSSISLRFRTQSGGVYNEAMHINSVGNVGIGTTAPFAKLHVNGSVRCHVLVISGGSDLSEDFLIGGKVKPGMVVSIDPQETGSLVVSSVAYDRRVAGIVSGAGGINTGMRMGQVGSIADGDHPVALTGRVYCWCDASTGAIVPGDLLTSSETPGHAMKVGDYARSPGTAIGKAMTSLESGTGLVLVLVNLQ